MPRELPSTSSKAAKKRYRLKKRKKRKLLKQKLKTMQANNEAITSENVTTTKTTKPKTKDGNPNKSHNKHMFAQTQHTKHNIAELTTEQQQKLQAEMVKKHTELWQQTYEKLVRWQQDQQVNFWRQRVEQLESENFKLKNQLKQFQKLDASNSLQTVSDEEYITSTDDEDDDAESEAESEQYQTSSEEELEDMLEDDLTMDEDVDPAYLEFLALTHKHRAERDAARAAAKAQVVLTQPPN